MEPSATGADISGAEHGGQGEAREVGLSAELNGPKSSEHTQQTELTSKHDYCSQHKSKAIHISRSPSTLEQSKVAPLLFRKY